MRSAKRPLLARLVARLLLLVLLLPAALAAVWFLLQPALNQEVEGMPAHVHALLSARHEPYTPVDHIAPVMQQAIVAIEDRRFYQHHGLDVHGMIRAVFDDLRNGNLNEGGATLTIQLVERTMGLPANPLLRALDVAALAWVTEDRFRKSQILAMYLNDVYYGRQAYGIAAAAQAYFGRTPATLTLRQAAFLAALPQAPSYYGSHPESAVVQGRWRTVIADMARQGYITSDQEQAATSHPLTVS